jgi:CheY-like chemotaxis protein
MKNQLLENQIHGNQLTAATGFGGWAAKVARYRAATETRRTETNDQAERTEVTRRVILLVSDDAKLDNGLRVAARAHGHIVITAAPLTDALRTARAACSHVALLDLDMDAERGWETADCLLETPKCPPVILMTGRNEQFEMRMAVNAGVVLDKTSEPGRILDLVNKILEKSPSALLERNAIQRAVIRWLRPLHWPMPSIFQHRHWGINE